MQSYTLLITRMSCFDVKINKKWRNILQREIVGIQTTELSQNIGTNVPRTCANSSAVQNKHVRVGSSVLMLPLQNLGCKRLLEMKFVIHK